MSLSADSGEKTLPKRVMAFGTFDLFHPGHEYYLSEAQKLAREMVVIVARDQRVLDQKGHSPFHTEGDRKKVIEKSFPKAKVLLGDEKDIFSPIRTYHPDILAFGYDQEVPEEEIHKYFPTLRFTRVPSFEPEKWKSSKLREARNEDLVIHLGFISQ